MTSDYDDKPSWSEIDKKKDSSKHVSEEHSESQPRSPKKEWVHKMYLKEIDSLFKGKKGSKEHTTALEAIHKKTGTKQFNTVVKKYVKEYGLPDDWSTLFLMIDYKDLKIVKQVLDTLVEMLDEEPLTVKEGFKSKLNIIAMTSSNEKLRLLAEETLEEI
jgi:hypothetical protein